MEFVCLIFGAAIVVGAFVFWNVKRVDNSWSDAAARMRIRYEKEGFGDRSIFGEHAGFQVRVSTYRTVVDNSTKTFTGYHIALRESLGLDLNMERQKAGARSSAARRRQDVIVGDPVFDPKAIITGSDENVIRDFLNADRRKILLRLFRQFDEFELDAKGIHVAKSGTQTNASFIESNVNLLIQTVNQLGRHQPVVVEEPNEVVPPPLPERPREPVDMDAEIELQPTAIAEAEIEAAHIAEIAALESAQIEEVKIAEIEATRKAEAAEAKIAEECAILARRVEEAKFAASQISEPVKIADSIRIDNSEAREKTAPVSVSASAEEPHVEVTPDPVSDSDADEFAMLCSEVFDSGYSRFEIGKQFDTHLKGQTKSGSGTLKKVDKFHSDIVFGRSPGIIAQIDVIPLEGGKTVAAHVEFSVDDTDITALKSKIGERIGFAGELLKCDVFNFRIYVGKAD